MGGRMMVRQIVRRQTTSCDGHFFAHLAFLYNEEDAALPHLFHTAAREHGRHRARLCGLARDAASGDTLTLQ